MKEVLTKEEVEKLFEVFDKPDPHKKIKEEAYKFIKDIKMLEYNTVEDMKDCADDFIVFWFDNFKKEKRDEDCLTYQLAEISGRDEDEIILDFDLMKKMYMHHLCAYIEGAHKQLSTLSRQIEMNLRRGILRTNDIKM